MTLEFTEIMDNIKKEDKVNHPSHYTWLKKLCGIEVIDITRHMNFNLGNVIKYVLRSGHKEENGYSLSDKEIEDLKKARWYLDDEIQTKSKEGNVDSVKDLKKEINYLKNKVETLEAKKRTILLSRLELITIYSMVLSNNTQFPIKLTQTSGSGIGLGTSLSFTDENNNCIEKDVTDYSSW